MEKREQNTKSLQSISLEQMKKIFENSYDGILVSDAEGTIIFATPSTSIYMGIDLTELIGKNVKGLVAEGIYDQSIILRAIAKKQQQSGVVVVSGKNRVFSTATPFFDDQGDLSMVITNVRAENILDKYHKELNDEKAKTTRYRSALSYLSRINSETNRIVAESPDMIRILAYLDKISKSGSTVLLLGESGTGKEVLSRYIHEKSNRSTEPFIPVNCAAIPKDLLESEFFGYEKGAFTGAIQSGKPGFFEMADHGTLFLDEIGELPLDMQSKLLRSIESGEFNRIGGTSIIKTDVRIIAATNQSLEEMVEQKKFRKDLYYRLNVIPIRIPPLRERKEDIIELAQMFLSMHLSKEDCDIILNSQMMNYLLSYDWPGNIRELKNVIERIAIEYTLEDSTEDSTEDLPEKALESLSRNIPKKRQIDKLAPKKIFETEYEKSSEAEALSTFNPSSIHEDEPIQDLKEYLHQVEKVYLEFVLNKCHWNVLETARQLGIHRSLLYRKLENLGIKRALK